MSTRSDQLRYKCTSISNVIVSHSRPRVLKIESGCEFHKRALARTPLSNDWTAKGFVQKCYKPNNRVRLYITPCKICTARTGLYHKAHTFLNYQLYILLSEMTLECSCQHKKRPPQYGDLSILETHSHSIFLYKEFNIKYALQPKAIRYINIILLAFHPLVR